MRARGAAAGGWGRARTRRARPGGSFRRSPRGRASRARRPAACALRSPASAGRRDRLKGTRGGGEAENLEDTRGGVERVAPEGSGRVRSPSRRAERERGREVPAPGRRHALCRARRRGTGEVRAPARAPSRRGRIFHQLAATPPPLRAEPRANSTQSWLCPAGCRNALGAHPNLENHPPPNSHRPARTGQCRWSLLGEGGCSQESSLMSVSPEGQP